MGCRVLDILYLMDRLAVCDEPEAKGRGETHGPHVVEAANQDEGSMAEFLNCGFRSALGLEWK